MESIKKFSLLVIFMFSIQVTLAQEYEFGNVTKEELEEETYFSDTDIDAAILYSYRDTYYQSNSGTASLISKYYKKIKIYSKDGFEKATEEINLFKSRYDEERVRKIKAVTYNLENGKIVEYELDKNQIFNSEVSYNYMQTKFTMPNVKEGSVIEIEYQVASPFIWNIDEFRFQTDIPIKKLEASIRTPKGFNFKQTRKGYVPFTSNQFVKMDHRAGMEMVVNTFNISQIPALKEEGLVDNIENYRAGVLLELVSIDIPGAVFKSYAQTWSDVAKTIGNADDYKNQLDKTRSFNKELDVLLQGKTDKLEIAKFLFKYVKENIQWNGVDGKYFQYGLKKTQKEKKGNVADINLSLVAMLRYAGIDANPVVLSTKDNAIPVYPTLERLNYVVCHAKIDNKVYFMDATEEFSDLNLMPIKNYNWRGLLINNEKMVWGYIDLIAPSKAVNMYMLNATVDSDGLVSGDYKSRLSNHTAFNYRESYKKNDEDTFLQELESKYMGIEISDYSVNNAESYEGTVTESFNFNFEEGAEVIGDKIYLSPILFLHMEENPFKKEERKYPIDFGYSFLNKNIIKLRIPEDYKVETLPSPVNMSLPEELGSFKYNIIQAGNSIQIMVNFEISKARISNQHYLFLKEFFKQIIIKEEERIILVKKTNGNTEGTTGGR